MIEIKSLNSLNKKLAKTGEKLVKVTTEIPDEITRSLALGANDIRNTIIENMTRSKKTGKYYRRAKKEHRASAPGEYPAVDSGELISRIIFDVRALEVEVGAEAGAPYAEYLEFGTSKMKPRPFLDPSVEKHIEDIINEVGKNIFEIIQKGTT